MVKPRTEYLIFFIILLAGAFLRLYNLGEKSLSNDELSALSRLQFDSFSELINTGVKPDYHPAGIQLLMWYWTKLFGLSPFSVRLPFAILGWLSIIPAFFLARRWFGAGPALLTASFVAFSEFTLLYSQTARPYAPGMFFILSLTWFWDRFIFQKKTSWLTIAGLAACFLLNMYNHYFSFLTAGIIGITGVFFIRGRQLFYYLLAGAIAVLVFIPHIQVTIEQLSRGGLSTWLGPPPATSLLDFIKYSFNSSWLVFFSSLALIFISRLNNSILKNRFRLLSLVWFLLVWAIAHFYSIWVNPVFQFSILIFVLPFLLFFLFSFAGSMISGWLLLSVLGLSATLLFSGLYVNRYYSTNHFGEFKGLALQAEKWNGMLGADRITYTANVNGEYYLQYYLKGKTTFETYELNRTGQSLSELADIVNNATTPYFALAWSTRFNPWETSAIIRANYPVVVSRIDFLNSGITLYGRGIPENHSNAEYQNLLDFEKPHPDWSTPVLLSDSVVFQGSQSGIVDATAAYGPTLALPLSSLSDSARFIQTEVWFKNSGGGKATLVISGERNGEAVSWEGIDLEPFSENKNGWVKGWIVHEITEKHPDDILKIYVWHREGPAVYIDNLHVKAGGRRILF